MKKKLYLIFCFTFSIIKADTIETCLGLMEQVAANPDNNYIQPDAINCFCALISDPDKKIRKETFVIFEYLSENSHNKGIKAVESGVARLCPTFYDDFKKEYFNKH
jgi:hypothetical protein